MVNYWIFLVPVATKTKYKNRLRLLLEITFVLEKIGTIKLFYSFEEKGKTLLCLKFQVWNSLWSKEMEFDPRFAIIDSRSLLKFII
jgi:hypothetical protein